MDNSKTYTCYALAREMLETPGILRSFRLQDTGEAARKIKKCGKLFLTGEGSSRIFPAKNAIRRNLNGGFGITIATEGSRQAAEYDLDDFVVFGASNSGRTKEVVTLFEQLKKKGHGNLFGLTANRCTVLESLCHRSFVLSCGKEDAVAATKSVVEQAMFYQSLLVSITGENLDGKDLAEAFEAALTAQLPEEMITALCNAGTIYFAGRNDGVAEELTLKTNEITRKKSDFLEGTYAVHGIEEVMNEDDVVLLIDPFDQELSKFEETLVKGVGLRVFALSSRETPFPTVKVKDAGSLTTFVYLALGWNILVETGIRLGVDLDKPVRARKVGNEVGI